ncbi:MAG: SH3 domain-containing protein [Leptolyngbya sp. Prado105]|jgi:hypothetical protein|nr:SH3 domain-containing protein [Leptolyngbya sp. Prado105]
MSVNVKTILKSPLAVGACITAVITVSGTLYAVAKPKAMVSSAESANMIQTSADDCKTIVFDDKPPLNVRANPIEQAGNIVGSLRNGDVVTVIGGRDGWLQISQPVVGWIYEKLTRQRCESDGPVATLIRKRVSDPALENLPNDSGSRLYRESVSHFQAGNLRGAIELAKAVPADSAAYPQARTALKTMPQTWDKAKTQFLTAVEAQEQSRWNDVLKIATNFPDIRYWREKLTPIVKRAIQMQHNFSDKEVQ